MTPALGGSFPETRRTYPHITNLHIANCANASMTFQPSVKLILCNVYSDALRAQAKLKIQLQDGAVACVDMPENS